MSAKVEKQMNGEAMTLLSDLMSLLTQLEQTMGTPAEIESEEPKLPTGEIVEDCATKKAEDEEEKEDDVEKGLENTPSEGATASDDSTEIIEDPEPDQSAANASDVAKALLKLLQPKPVKKSLTQNEVVTKTLQEITKVVKALSEKQTETDNALVNILTGLGIADQVEKSYPTTTTERVVKGYNNPKDVEATINYLAKTLGIEKKEETSYITPTDTVHKTLSSKGVMAGLLGKK